MKSWQNFNIKSGFTLSEVLITLVILGVIAAMTIPTTIAKVETQERQARVKKTFSTISNAFTRSQADLGNFVLEDLNEDSINEWYYTYIKPYLSTLKICYGTAGCWEGKTQFLKGGDCYYSDNSGIGTPRVNVVLSDGTNINFDVYNAEDIYDKYKVYVDLPFSVVAIFDINGTRSPNTFGKDTFAMIYTTGGFVPSFKDATKAEINSDCSNTGTGYSCIMNYL